MPDFTPQEWVLAILVSYPPNEKVDVPILAAEADLPEEQVVKILEELEADGYLLMAGTQFKPPDEDLEL